MSIFANPFDNPFTNRTELAVQLTGKFLREAGWNRDEIRKVWTWEYRGNWDGEQWIREPYTLLVDELQIIRWIKEDPRTSLSRLQEYINTIFRAKNA